MLLTGSLLFVALIGVGVAMVVLALGGPPPGAADGPWSLTALHVREDRYARGEIDRQDFEERRSTLQL